MNLKPVAVVMISAVAATFSGGAAVASAKPSAHAVSGTVYAGGKWFRSSEIRAVHDNNTAISISMSKIPAQCDGVDWFLNVASEKHPKLGNSVTLSKVGATAVLATQVRAGTQFQNNFKQHKSAGGVGEYEFTGTMVY